MTSWTADTDWIWRTTMATPHNATVQREASEHGLDASYVYAIMRKESAFDPKVVSYADAYGLMQLLHGTAIKVARKLGDPEPTRDDLFRPAINIRLGTALLAQLETELGSERALSMAGYNAGSHRVHQWLKHVSAKELDRFVEEIPIDQTRNYVRRVHANWARYRYYYEPEREPVTLNLELNE
jgi:soluble lytic murein transglycosylase